LGWFSIVSTGCGKWTVDFGGRILVEVGERILFFGRFFSSMEGSSFLSQKRRRKRIPADILVGYGVGVLGEMESFLVRWDLGWVLACC
jgi:hypothetical protein